ncbi:YggS family pyridoxal phosphate-dependent enzyme [Candidatus Pelagibacter sp. FZCC0015]|uniref:YggS family pyridoxal phosphate-dependent enzyme n=1 Tax=Candidatus Pelagibacter sp. FZCC0015 TaxID=2268451 RepID=UPI00119FD1B1|nr:YggS family pyridoxal phosphate-dependent enzyme [Candidatus Pelagibacter sp. FZCC0015]
MHNTVHNLLKIQNRIKDHLNILNITKFPKIIAVSKTFKIDKILPLIDSGHIDFGENKVQEALEKWTEVKKNNSEIKLHMIGKLQTNKVKFAVQLFDYIHSVDSEKLAKKIAEEESKINRKTKIFLQVNIGDEKQKSGVNKSEIENLVTYCKKINLNILGLMCIPPANIEPAVYFEEMSSLNKSFNFDELSMGMSSDYLKAARYNSTYLRIGASIFGQRS